MVALEEIEMPKLSLMFDNKIMKEVPVGSRPVTIGRSPDNDLPVDNLAVSNYHAKIYFEAGRMVIEDLDSLNGTFVNDLRVERATLHDGDNIHIGKHKIRVDTSGDAPVPWDSGRKTAAPRIDETMVLDTKERRQMLQQAAAMGESMQFASARMKVPTLVVLSGRTDQKERSEEHTSELQSQSNLVCRLLLEKKKNKQLYTQRPLQNAVFGGPVARPFPEFVVRVSSRCPGRRHRLMIVLRCIGLITCHSYIGL